MRTKYWLSLTIFLSGTALAEPVVDLLQAWQSAQQHDAVFAAAQADYQAGQQKHKQSVALLLPQVQAGATLGMSSAESRTSGAQFAAPGFGTSNDVDFRTDIDRGQQQRWVVTAQQPLYNAERFANSRQLDSQSELASAQYSGAEQELILRVAQSYFDVLLANDTESLLDKQKAAARRALDEARARFDSGDIPITDAHEAQARFDAIAAQALAAQSDAELKRTAFADVTGLAPDSLLPIAAVAAQPLATLAEWQARAAKDNPQLAMQLRGVDIARADVDKFAALKAPTVDLIAQASDDNLDGDGAYGSSELESSAWMVGVQINVPIFTGGMRSAKHAEAIALTDKAQRNLDAARQLVARQTQAAWLGVTSGEAQVRALEQARRSAEARLQSTQLGRQNGARTTLDLLDAETDFYATERGLKQAQYNLLINRLRLAAMAGALDENALRAANDSLQSGR